MVQKLDTHYYDGKLKNRFAALQQKVTSHVSLDICWREIKELIDARLRRNRHSVAMMIWNRLKADLESASNFDQRSGIRVEDVLPLVWTLVREWDDSGKDAFLEQWVDIKGGMCPQGRVARLLQMGCWE